ncbi:hypothetical protein GGE65_008141 [Skermanella aerolata]|uniref:hypothetical protein n=1 Tax=Skermanella aerolata TaxID=393310 RepID=UPI003D1CBF1F
MFADTYSVPCAAWLTLEEMSRVAALCSSMAAAMVVAISFIWPMILPMPLIATCAPLVAPWISLTLAWISSVALAVGSPAT